MSEEGFLRAGGKLHFSQQYTLKPNRKIMCPAVKRTTLVPARQYHIAAMTKTITNNNLLFSRPNGHSMCCGPGYYIGTEFADVHTHNPCKRVRYRYKVRMRTKDLYIVYYWRCRSAVTRHTPTAVRIWMSDDRDFGVIKFFFRRRIIQ